MTPYESKDFIKLIAIAQAMEKQNPKKPEKVIFEDDYDFRYLCPNHCKPYYEVFEGMNYCPNCGQKLGWEKEK